MIRPFAAPFGRPFVRSFGRGSSGAAPTYKDKVLAIEPASLLAYWPLNEASGTAIVNAAPSGSGLNGVYTGVDLANRAGLGASMGASPYWDAVNDKGNLLTAALAAAFNGSALTLMHWFYVTAAEWARAGTHYLFYAEADANNYVGVYNISGVGLVANYNAGGTAKYVIIGSPPASAWTLLTLTADKAAGANGQVKIYLGAAQQGTTQTALGTWSGALASALLGAHTVAPVEGAVANLQGCGLWSKALTAAQVANLAVAV